MSKPYGYVIKKTVKYSYTNHSADITYYYSNNGGWTQYLENAEVFSSEDAADWVIGQIIQKPKHPANPYDIKVVPILRTLSEKDSSNDRH